MQDNRPWLRRVALATAILGATAAGAATSYADTTASSTRLSGARYRLQVVSTGAPCDSVSWRVFASSNNEVTLNPDNQPTVEAVVGVGLYVFEASCMHEDASPELSYVTLDSRPTGLNDIPAPEVWQVPFQGPLCLTCPDWVDPVDASMLEIREEGLVRTDVDFSVFGEAAQGWQLDPTPTPMLPKDVELNFGGLDTFVSNAKGVDLGAGLTLVGYAFDGAERITVGALDIGESGLVVGAFLIEAYGDPSPQPS